MTEAAAAPAELASASARLEVQALPDCTTREEVAARVAARSRRIHFDDEQATGPTVRAVIAHGPHGAVGELVIVQPDGRTSSRRLSAASCAEATDAIALIIALTLDPTSVSTSAPAPAAAGRPGVTAPPLSPPQSGPTPPQPAANAPPPSVAEAAPTRPPGPARSPENPPTPERQAPPSPSAGRGPTVVSSPAAPPVVTQSRFGGGATGQAIFGLAPGALPGLGVYLIAALDREALWSPALVVTGTHAWSNGLVETGGTAAFTLDALTLDACPLRLHLAPAEARACGTALYGRLGASGSHTYSQTTASRPFAAAGGALLVSLELGRLFELSGRFGASASLIRDSFAFTPAVFHRTAAVTMAAGLGLGVRFP
ncbi:MAG TPA: hypothetical protein VLA79_02010 [Polyangia bacterium]|nr:hypothetical protein [Polyangia bacterium]